MVAEAWIVKMGNQVSSNLKHALLLEFFPKKKKNTQSNPTPKKYETVGIHLHKSLSETEISKLKFEIIRDVAAGVRFAMLLAFGRWKRTVKELMKMEEDSEEVLNRRRRKIRRRR
ncbi:hypothetical protein CCACVL1_27619 [Corchorus capsularis]|uniref:Uncharacterized protein n=1 Tax=Corchorus capsularis TaxID=210143 RepID=A0A1R3G9L3_COCAP|nr:hypothetical protein CCACVL1_27619 [Corchorus capsularis]